MRAHELDENGKIINTIAVESLNFKPGLVNADIYGGQIGDSIVGGVLVPAGGLPAEPPTVPPTVVSMREAQLALLEAGLLDTVEATIEAIPDEAMRARARVEWRTARDVERNNVVLQLVAGEIGLGDQELDELFLMAAGYAFRRPARDETV